MPYDRLCSVPLRVRKFDALLTLRLRCVWTASAFFFPDRRGSLGVPSSPSVGLSHRVDALWTTINASRQCGMRWNMMTERSREVLASTGSARCGHKAKE
jgi:hypothetical protein